MDNMDMPLSIIINYPLSIIHYKLLLDFAVAIIVFNDILSNFFNLNISFLNLLCYL